MCMGALQLCMYDKDTVLDSVHVGSRRGADKDWRCVRTCMEGI